MPARVGNQHAKKLDTPELRQEAYRQYCDYIATGYQKKSWYFDHPDITLTWETMEKYIRLYPDEFDSTQMQIAEAKSLRYWEEILYAAARGINKDANIAGLQIIFRNKFKWDKLDAHSEGVDISASFNNERLIEQINSRQMIAQQPAPPATASNE